MLRRRLYVLLAFVLLYLAAAAVASAQGYSADRPLGAAAQQVPGYLAHAGVEQRLGQPLPLSDTYTDEAGRTAPLSTWLNGKPVAVVLVYYRCAMLCPQVLHGLATGLRGTTLQPGKDYGVLVFSIDPGDKPADALTNNRQSPQPLGTGNSATGSAATEAAATGAIHFFTSTQASIDDVARATGFHYVRVPGPDGKLDQYAHSSVVMFATPDGRLSKYLSGVDYPPRDLRLALLGASEHRISNPVDLLILYCCSYNPTVGRYSVSIMHVLSIAGMLAVFLLIGMLVLLTRKPRASAAA